MNVLKGYIKHNSLDFMLEVTKKRELLESQLKEINDLETESYVSLLKTPEFKIKYRERLRRVDKDLIALEIRLINLIKAAYKKAKEDDANIGIAYEDSCRSEILHTYCDTATPEFNDCEDLITESIERLESCNWNFHELCELDFRANGSYCKQLIYTKYIYDEGYEGAYSYFFKRKDYPIVLALYDIYAENQEEIKQIMREEV